MFESRSPRNFNSAPQSVTAFIATVLEPAITVLVYLGALAWHGEDVGRAENGQARHHPGVCEQEEGRQQSTLRIGADTSRGRRL